MTEFTKRVTNKEKKPKVYEKNKFTTSKEKTVITSYAMDTVKWLLQDKTNKLTNSVLVQNL